MLAFTDCMTSFLGSVKKDYPVYIADHRISDKDPGQCYKDRGDNNELPHANLDSFTLVKCSKTSKVACICLGQQLANWKENLATLKMSCFVKRKAQL